MPPAPKLEHRAQDTERILKIHCPARFRRLGRWAKRRGGICRPNSIVLRLLGEPPPPPAPPDPLRKTRWSTRNNRRRKRVEQLVRRRGSCRVLRLRHILLATSFWQLLLSRLALAPLSLSLSGRRSSSTPSSGPVNCVEDESGSFVCVDSGHAAWLCARGNLFVPRAFRYHDLGPVEDIVNISACLRLPVAIEWNTRRLCGAL